MNFRFHSHEPKPYSFFLEHSEPFAKERLAEQFLEQLDTEELERPIVLVCIGSDRSTGDSLGPLVGTFLESHHPNHIHVYGTLSKPVHALNLAETMEQIEASFERPLVIAIDACLGRLSSVGFVFFSEGSLAPGAGVQKELPAVGDYNIKAVVNVSGFMEMMILQNTRLHLVYELAQLVANSFISFDRKLTARTTSRTTIEFTPRTI
ncbi:spore protease YyaC [Exiguobacterium flavidum]|uniref:spore protease YyaC n=1 Tax=Exiguobacterium flavidum TaxID=2184695 RepID=UPI000DF758EE|nr:spore protease YyaC [Exiguobacterium flavidum]